MYRREAARNILQGKQTTHWTECCLSAIRSDLSEELRPAAYALLNLNEHGEPINQSQYTREAISHHRESVERGLKTLAALDPTRRIDIFSALVLRLASTVESAWQLRGRLPYQVGIQRRAFRAPGNETAVYTARITWLRCLITILLPYRDQNLTWFAAWAPYFEALNYPAGSALGLLFAAAIDEAGATGEAVFDVLIASARGQHPVGRMGRHVVTGLLAAARSEGWACIEHLLLAAQREEGLRQIILETIDEAHPQAFRRMLQLVLDHDLTRFSATVRAVDVWFGFGWTVEDARSVRSSIDTILTLLADSSKQQEAIAHGHPQQAYFALWASAFENASSALSAATPLLHDALPERRLVATHLLCQLDLPEAQAALLSLLADADLRVALLAFSGLAGVASTFASSDLFEQLEQLLARLGSSAKTIGSGIWPWLLIRADAARVLHTMIECLGKRTPTRLIVYLPRMNAWDRIHTAEKLADLPIWDEAIRSEFYRLLSDRSHWVHDRVLALVARHSLDNTGTTALELLLTRKRSSLRRGILTLLLKESDEAVLSSAERLLTAAHPLQRLAGLELLKALAADGRAIEQSRIRARTYSVSHAVLTTEEATLINAILAVGQGTEAPTRENVLGLISPDSCAPRVLPRPQAFDLDTPAAYGCMRELDALVEEHRTTPVTAHSWRGSEEIMLGDLSWRFPFLKDAASIEEDVRAHLPLARMWLDWEHERPAELHDADGLEMVRALLLARRQCSSRGPLNGVFNLLASNSVLAQTSDSSQPEREGLQLSYPAVVSGVLGWLVPLQGISVTALNFLLDVAETTLAGISVTELEREESDQRQPWGHNDVRSHLLWQNESLQVLQRFFTWFPDSWTPAHIIRYWQLLHWLDQQTPALSRRQPPLKVLLAAYRAGAATEADILDQLGGPVGHPHHYRGSGDLQMLTTRRPDPLLEEHPLLQSLVSALRQRILEIELERGEMPTAATALAFSLRTSGGISVFVRLVTALAPTDFARGYVYDNESKGTTLSHLLRISFPAPDDTPEAFAYQIAAAHLDHKHLVAAALYAPQWASYVERVLGWPHFEEAVWWIYAHTKDVNWGVDQEIRATWRAQIAERTPITAADLLDGAVDVAWFWRSYRGLGAERWEQVYTAAKYASNGSGHGRARLFADAMTGRVSAEQLHQRMFARRQQDAVRTLGLVSLPIDDKARYHEITARYAALQEFLRTGRQFGAQRRASEETATRIGLENLARTAGYPDPIRLQWAMEAQFAADLRNGALTVTERDIRVTLALTAGTAEPYLTVIKGDTKVLKALPAKLKQQAQIAALLARKREVEQQLSRMRSSLESAICRGDYFTASELFELLTHPVLSHLLQSLIFVHSASGNVLGYPLCCDDGAGPQLLFRNYSGETTPVERTASDLRLAHPYDLLASGVWHEWQHECFTSQRIQSFKQVFRELYIRSLNETRHGDETLSWRYSGHQVQPRQALALLGQRGWIADEEAGVCRTFHAEGLVATVSFAQGIFTPAEVEGQEVETICFIKHGECPPMPLADVPPRIFSEVMRDLDLVVSVAHSGGVDPEATASTIEMRAALIGETCILLDLANVELRSAHALIAGTFGNYTVHLGSAVVHRQPGGALCIMPAHAQQRGRLFLPFADDDPKTAEIVSKIVILARDKEIKDPGILQQLL